jgi:hypothetical protein
LQRFSELNQKFLGTFSEELPVDQANPLGERRRDRTSFHPRKCETLCFTIDHSGVVEINAAGWTVSINDCCKKRTRAAVNRIGCPVGVGG